MKNEVNRAFMAKNYKYIVLILLLIGSLTASARTYQEGDKVYVNIKQSDGLGDWSQYGAKLFLYFFQSSSTGNSEWVTLTPVAGSTFVYEGHLQATHTWYDRVSVVRKSPSGTAGNWNDRWSQSCDIRIPDNGLCTCNMLNEFYAKNKLEDECVESYDWKAYAPPAANIPSVDDIESSGVTKEHIQICESTWGGPFSLWVKLNGDKTAYNFSDVRGHAWYSSTDGTNWTALEPTMVDVALDGLDNKIQINENVLPSKPSSGEIYYFLHSSVLSGRRLIHLTTDAGTCDLDCAITSFETAVSNVNADDNTYTLDGIVAFGEPNGNLIVSCDGNTLTITSPHSPQAFSLHNLPATSTAGLTTTVTAYFEGDPLNCHHEKVFNVPNVVEIVEVIRKDVLTGDEVELVSPTAESDNDYIWVDEYNVEHPKSSGQIQTWTIPASRFTTDETTSFEYREYYQLDGSMEDLMANGNYEEAFDYGTYGNVSTISDYNFWGKFPETNSTQINFYENSTVNPSNLKDNGFAVVRNAHNFYPTYANVTAREGSNFALFDARTGVEGGNKKAWFATTASNPKLKLKKGTRYVLSFWAANINNYGEMDNAARFKFYVEDISDPLNPIRIDSSEVLDLSIPAFRNNIWHQCSETFYAQHDYNNVRISVFNLNTNTLNIGNDFALDDIQFHAISTVTKAVKSFQKFVVVAHEPKVDAFTATVVPLACDGGPSYTVNMHVTYQNPKGRLIIKDETTGIEYPYTVSAPWDTQKNLDESIVINTGEASHNWTAYFEDWTTAAKSTSTVIPGFPKAEIKNLSFSDPTSPCATVTRLTFDLDYTYQQGAFSYWVDEMSPVTGTTYSIADKSLQTLSGLVFNNIPADGKTHTLHVKFNGPNSCEKTKTFIAPFSPVIDEVIVTGVPTDKLPCSTESYTVNVEVTTHFDAKSYTLKVEYNDNGIAKTATAPAATPKTIIPLTLTNMDDVAQTVTVSIVELPGCPAYAAYIPPTLARITPNFDVNVGENSCNELNYTVSGTIHFDQPDGNLIVQYGSEHKQVIPVAPGSTSANFSIPDMTASGTGLTLKAWFENSATTACTVVSNTFDAPIVPSMAIHADVPTMASCATTASVTFSVDYIYQQGLMEYWIDNQSHQTKAITKKSAVMLTESGLTLSGFNADGKTHTIHVKFNGPNSCEDSFPFLAPLSPVIDEVIVTGVPTDKLPCSTESYTVNVEVTTHFDLTNYTVVVEYDDNGIAKTATAPATTPKTIIPLTLTNMDDAAQTVTVSILELPGCPAYAAYIPPTLARITPNFDVNVGENSCNELNYTVSGTIHFDQPDGNLIVQYGSEHKQVIPVAPGSTSANFSIPDMTASGTGLRLEAWFENSATTACTVVSNTFDAPVVPSMDIHADVPTMASCATTASVTFSVDYIYQQGLMEYWIDNQSHQTKSITKKSAVMLTESGLTLSGFNADGKTHTIHVKFNGPNSCEKTKTVTAPFSQVITSVAVTGVPATILCDETSYNVNVAITTPFDATGKNIVLSYEGKDTTIAVTGNPTNVVLPLTTAGTTGLTISAAYNDSPTCATISNSYDAPTRLSCIKEAVTKCVGESFFWDITNKTYGPFMTVGIDTIASDMNVHDSLFVTVHPQPAISLIAIDTLYADATEIRLPYTVTEGTPNKFVITWAGSSTTQARSAVDTLVISKPAGVTTGDYTVTVQAIDSNFITCNTSAAMTIHIAGIPTVNSVSVQAREVACGADTYKADVHIEYVNPRGDIILEDKTNGTIYTYPVPKVPYNTTYTLDTVVAFSSMTPAVHNWEAYFNEWSSATASSTAPTVPSMAINSVTPADADCNLTTGVSFDVDYIYQQGELRYWVDKMAYNTMTITPKDATQHNTGSLSFAGFNADNKQHMLHVQFTGTNSCEDSIPFTALLSQKISSVAVTGVPATILCDETSYNVNVAITTPFDATGKNIVLSYEGKDTTIAVTGNPTNVVLPLTTAGTTGLTISAAYNDSPTCATISNSYDAPTRLSCIKEAVTKCVGESFFWDITNKTYGPFMTVGIDTIASDMNVHDSLFVTVHPQPAISLIAIDTLYADATEIRLPYTVTEGTPNKFVITWAGSSTTQARSAVDTLVISKPAGVTTGDYTVTVQAIDSNFITCNTSAAMTIHIAGIPTVNSVSVQAREVACGADTYKADVHIEYVNPRGDIILEDKTNGTIYTYPVPKVPYNTTYTLDTVVAFSSMTPAVHNWEAYFNEWSSATASSTAPTVPSMAIHINEPTMVACATTAEVTFSVDYTYQQGQMEYWIDDQAHQFRAITEKSATLLTESGLTLNGFDADYKTHTIHVKFNGPNSCEKTESFLAPFSPVIDDVSVTGVPATILCDELSYNVAVVVTTHFDATGKNIVLSYEGKDTTITAAGNPTVVSLTMISADASGLTVSAALSDAPACATVSNTYNAPARWSCDRDYKDICLGDTYTWHGTPYTPTSAGTFGYNDNYDSLYLTVHAEPRVMMQPAEMICADENQIRLPFVVTDGTPNLFDVTINGQSFSQAKSNTDTIVLNRPTSIPAGTYTATITVRDSLVNCFSTIKAIFTIAQAEMMYRKWDDLIFIDNSDNLFTAYQWYENGIALSNETNQYLHTPNGLPGIYCCRMITTTNDTIYTCEKAFDDIPRSRDITYTTQNITVSPTYVRTRGSITIRQTADTELHITLYDATGKVISQHTQMNEEDCISAPYSEGIYFVRVQYGEDMKTVKIIVHE